jgi:hypothetical protein
MTRVTTPYLIALAMLACNPGEGESNTDGSITSDSTAEATGGAVGRCAGYCAKLVECSDPKAADCPESCPDAVAGYEYAGAACGALSGEYLDCKAATTCETLAQEQGLCQEQLDALVVDDCTTEVCDTYADHLIECGLAGPDLKVARAFECTMALSEAHVSFGAACGEAAEASVACANLIPCEQLIANTGCEAEGMAIDMLCG